MREAEPYGERKVMENVSRQGANVIKAHLRHLDEHGESAYVSDAIAFLREHDIPVPDYKQQANVGEPCGCPGSAAADFRNSDGRDKVAGRVPVRVESELRQWPVQLKLLNPAASYFDNAHLLLSADCVPFAYGNFHEDFLKDKIVIMFCPKLDPYREEYIDKLAAILSLHDIQSITVARMEVPCCGGVSMILDKAMEKSGKALPVRESIISIRGEKLHEDPLPAARAL